MVLLRSGEVMGGATRWLEKLLEWWALEFTFRPFSDQDRLRGSPETLETLELYNTIEPRRLCDQCAI